MIVSTKGRYALRVMIDLAEHQSEKYVPLKEVAARQEISEKYLENILKVLVQNGFLEGLRGKGGGYRLTRSPDQYTVSEILMLTEGSLAPVSCLTPGASACARMANCRTYEMWKGLNDLISDYFWQDHTGRPCPAGSGRQRLCDLNLAHRNCTGAPFLHSSAQKVQNFLARFTVDGAGSPRYTFTLCETENSGLKARCLFVIRP